MLIEEQKGELVKMWFDIIKVVDIPLGFSIKDVEENLEQEIMFNPEIYANVAVRPLVRLARKFYNWETKQIDEVKLKQALMSSSSGGPYPEKTYELIMRTLLGSYSKDPAEAQFLESERRAHNTPKEEWPSN